MKHHLLLVVFLAALPATAVAHHGVASLGVAGLEGPGAPVESASSATLPDGAWLFSLKLDYPLFEVYTPERDDESVSNAFWIYGVGQGLTPAWSIYAFVPYTVKKSEDNGFNSAGFADIALMAVLGWKLDDGPRLVPAGESLDDLEDWHFTFYGGATLPTGQENLRDADGGIDPGRSLGFGRPSFMAGWTTTKTVGTRSTLVADVSWIGFQKNEYDDGQQVKFGTEWRLNTAWTLRVLTDAKRKLRLDTSLEANGLALSRDEVNGVGEEATGGRIIYALPGLRAYIGSSSLGLGWKQPIWTDLNEESLQQGAEGTEKGRFVATWSTLF